MRTHDLFVVVPFALLVISAVPEAQACGSDVLLKRLDAATSGPDIRTPGGAPVIGAPFEFRVENAQPNMLGALVFSPVVSQAYSADYDAVFWFGLPYGQKFFGTDDDGCSPALFGGVVDPFLCGEPGVFQAGVFDPAATGGVAVTDAIWLRVGGNGNFSFPAARKYDSASVIDLAVADFDEDGRADVVTLDENPFQVTLRLGADLESAQTLPAGIGSQAVATDDLNGDGHADLVIVNLGSNDVSILLGDGAGAFSGPTSYAVGTAPVGLAVGLVNGDAVPDVVVVNLSSGSLSLLIGNGDGTFKAAATIAPFLLQPRAVAIGDWDGDGTTDLAVGAFVNRVHILLGNGNSTFDLQTTITLSGTPFAVAVGDYDEDTVPDLAVVRFDLGLYTILLGQGDGTFAQGATAETGGLQPADLAVGDIDGDGHLDLLTANRVQEFALHRGLGDGTFAPLALPLIDGPAAAGIGDVNGDGRLDVVVGSDTSLYVHTPGVDGAILGPLFPIGFSSEGGAFADVTGDGLQDLVVVKHHDNFVEVYPGLGGDQFGAVSQVPTTPIVVGAEAADLDGDGAAEIVTWGTGSVEVFRGGSFALADDLATTPTSSVRIADASGDGIPDLVFIDELAGQQRISVHRGNGDGTLGAATHSNIAAPPTELVLADVDGDGVLDAIHDHFVTDEVAVRLGTGSGFFVTQVGHAVGVDPERFALGDFDGDTVPDLLVTGKVPFGTTLAPVVELSLGNGDGTFQAPSSLDATDPGELVVADFDGDARTDFLVTSGPNNEFSIFQNLGAGAFARTTLVLDVKAVVPPTAYREIIPCELDGDGIPDLLVYYTRQVRVLLNQLGE